MTAVPQAGRLRVGSCFQLQFLHLQKVARGVCPAWPREVLRGGGFTKVVGVEGRSRPLLLRFWGWHGRPVAPHRQADTRSPSASLGVRTEQEGLL